MNLKEIVNKTDKYVLGTYSRVKESYISAKGCWLKTVDKKPVLDFFPGWGVSNLGHCHPLVSGKVAEQAKRIIHLANVFYMPMQGVVAEKIIKKSFPGKVFFCNSGTESVEAAIKAARAWGKAKGKDEIIAFNKSFHGRTCGAVTVTGQKKYRDPFGVLLPKVKYADYNNIDSVRAKITKKTAAVILELVQGEGGVRPADKKFVKKLSELAKKENFLLIFDEVQTGFGRTGKMFAFKNYAVKPDIMCLGKAIANGVPMGATVFAKSVEKVLGAGMHASTFGGNYLACSAADAVFDVFEKDDILNKMKPVQAEIKKSLTSLKKTYAEIKEFRSLGMMFGLELTEDNAAKIAEKAFDKGLIINCTAGNVLRIMPALNMNMTDCRKGLKIITAAFKEVLG